MMFDEKNTNNTIIIYFIIIAAIKESSDIIYSDLTWTQKTLKKTCLEVTHSERLPARSK